LKKKNNNNDVPGMKTFHTLESAQDVRTPSAESGVSLVNKCMCVFPGVQNTILFPYCRGTPRAKFQKLPNAALGKKCTIAMVK